MEAREHRARARQALKGRWVTAVLVTLVASLVGGSVGSSNFSVNVNGSDLSNILSVTMDRADLALLATVGSGIVLWALVRFAISILLGSVVQLGHAKFCLNLIDGQEVTIESGFATLFSQFSRYAQAVILNLLTGLFVLLWSLLLVVPGIIAVYSYAMAPYILAEDLNCTAPEAIDRSKELMKGHKLELFVLDLSFIGWFLLSILTMGLGGLALKPYVEVSHASFYRSIAQAPQPEEPAF